MKKVPDTFVLMLVLTSGLGLFGCAPRAQQGPEARLMAMSLSLDKTSFVVGEPIAVGVTLRNVSKRELKMQCRPNIAQGIGVAVNVYQVKDDGRERHEVLPPGYYRWRRDGSPLEDIILKPGEELTTWAYLQFTYPNLEAVGAAALDLQAQVKGTQLLSETRTVTVRSAMRISEPAELRCKTSAKGDRTLAYLAREQTEENARKTEAAGDARRPRLYLYVVAEYGQRKSREIRVWEDLGPCPGDSTPTLVVDRDGGIHVLHERVWKHWTYIHYPASYTAVRVESFGYGDISKPVPVLTKKLVGDYVLKRSADGKVVAQRQTAAKELERER